MSETVKTCRTCEHRDGDKCDFVGGHYQIERKFPSRCGDSHKGWQPREPLLIRLQHAIYKPRAAASA